MTPEILTAYRKLYPRSRRTESTAIIHSGGRQTIYGCVCGAEHTTSTEWKGREAKHVLDWRAEHANCMKQIVEKQGG
jgi:hypothetical protein